MVLFGFNDLAEVVFVANLTGTGVVPGNNQGLYAGSPGGVVEIVRKGDAIDFGNGSGLHTVSSILPSGATLSNSAELVYRLSFTDGTSGIFTSIIGGSATGDFNHDGIVDAADYVVWRKGLGTTYTQNDYNVWRAHFGQTSGSGSSAIANAAVPEPTTFVLLMFAAAGWCFRRARTA